MYRTCMIYVGITLVFYLQKNREQMKVCPDSTWQIVSITLLCTCSFFGITRLVNMYYGRVNMTLYGDRDYWFQFYIWRNTIGNQWPPVSGQG